MAELNFDVISLNTAGLGDFIKRRKVFNYLKKHVSRKGIVFLQETHSLRKDEKMWTNQFGCGTGSIIFSHGKSDARGVLIAFREAVKYSIRSKHVDKEGRYIVLDVLIDNNPVILVNYYAPNVESDQLKYFDELTHIFDQLQASENTTFIWGGDFNLFFDIELDADGGSPKLKVKSVSKLLSMMSENDLCDIFRIRNPETKHFTWRRKSPFKQRRLDFFLISDILQENIKSIDIIPSVQSDHSAILLKLSPATDGSRGRAYWKFNSSLTQDKYFTDSLKTQIPNFVREASAHGDPLLRWEYMKFKCREFSRNYSIQKSKERKLKRLSLEKRIADLENSISSNSSQEVLDEYHKCKSDLETLYDYITAGIILRSKTNWYEHGEKSSKYFLNLEKRNKAKSHIRKLLTEHGQEINRPDRIMSHIKGFYSSLYKRRSAKTEAECLKYLSTFSIPKLSQSESDSCEGLFNKRECWEALSSMKNGKSPGNDGLTREFYVCFFDEICDFLIEALNESFNIGQMSNSQRQAVITLIEKKDKDKRLLKNWRPISLINVDAKIASKILASRVKKVLASIVNHDQTAYVKGRYIGESIRLVNDIFEFTEKNDISGLLFSADFEKAFDSIEHSFLFAALKSFGFGPQFIQWVRAIFRDAESCVMNNGHSTGYFPLERGTRQGDPLSAYLFILCVETLFIQIRESDNVKGIKLGNFEVKLSAYADDADFLTSDACSLKTVFQICDTFYLYSSLKLNLEKSEACWIGDKMGCEEKPINCKWVNIKTNAIRALGVFNSYDTDLEQKLNFLDNLKCLNDVLRLWEFRGLTLAGRILIFKSLALSKLLYACTMKVPSKFIIDQLNTLQKNFIWNNKRPKIKHSTLIADYKEGGYKDVDIENKIAALKTKWVTRLIDKNFHPWKIIPNLLLSDTGGVDVIFHQNLQVSKQCIAQIKQFPKFYQDLIQIWALASENEPSNAIDIGHEVLWNNKLITSNGESLFNRQFIIKGILTVRDIMGENGSPLSWQDAQERYSLSNALTFKWYGLVRSIPRKWKNELSISNAHLLGTNEESRMINITSKTAYKRLVTSLIKPPTAQKSLASLLGLTDIDWSNVYMLPRQVTIESSLRSFQYKILNNVLYLNEKLFKFKIIESPLCSLCKKENESVIHLFCTCTVTRNLFEHLRLWLAGISLLENINLEPQAIILGIWDTNNDDFALINHILLLFKRYIYLKRAERLGPNINGMKSFIKSIETIECRIASAKDKLSSHYKKWEKLLPLL